MKLSAAKEGNESGFSYVKTSLPLEIATLSLCGDDGIEFCGQKFVPDATKAFFTFAVSHAFPNATVRGEAIHPNVVAMSYQSMLHQNVNYEHQIAKYYEGKKDVRDRVIGSVVAVDFPGGPHRKWLINKDSAVAPGITGVASVFKQTQGTAKMFGDHQVGRKKFTVSMEALWPLEDAGFAVELAPGAKQTFGGTPEDFLSAGWEYVPYEGAPKELQNCWSTKSGSILKRFQGRRVLIMCGGLNTPVHYAGIGVVSYGAERAAKITRLIASNGEPTAKLDKFAGALQGAFTR